MQDGQIQIPDLLICRSADSYTSVVVGVYLFVDVFLLLQRLGTKNVSWKTVCSSQPEQMWCWLLYDFFFLTCSSAVIPNCFFSICMLHGVYMYILQCNWCILLRLLHLGAYTSQHSQGISLLGHLQLCFQNICTFLTCTSQQNQGTKLLRCLCFFFKGVCTFVYTVCPLCIKIKAPGG